MLKKIIGIGVATVIGGTTFAISQSDVVSNFSNNTGMSQEQAQQYIDNAKDDLASFPKVGQSFIDDSSKILTEQSTIDCANYTYTWESATLTCTDGKNQLIEVGNDELKLGNCFVALGSDLGNSATAKMTECISDIDEVNADYDAPIVGIMLDSAAITESKNTNAYNRSVLEAALKSK